MLRFLHAADLHLDSPLLGLERYEGAPADRIRDSTRRALENLVRLAVAERVTFVLLAGDVYDGNWKDYATGLFFSTQMARLRQANIPVFLIRGNHDAANLMTRSLDLPENVRVFPDDVPRTYCLDDQGVAVHGQGFAARETRENLAASYPAPVAGYFNIGLLHTSLQGNAGHDTYAPCSLEQLCQKGYDYWALGHIHQRQEVRPKNPAVVFPGNIQGRHVRETGAKGCQVVTVAAGRIVANEFKPLDVVRWEFLELDASGLGGLEEILESVEERTRASLASAEGRLLAIRLRITGTTPAHGLLASQREGWIQQCRARCTDRFGDACWIEEIRLATAPPGDAASEKLPEDALAELQNLVEELRHDDAALEKLLGLGDLRFLDKGLPAALKQGNDPLLLTRADFGRGLLDRVLPLITSPRWHPHELS